MIKKPMVILTGPTAVGKTELSISLAKAINGAIISADSMQVYKYMDIGSAKIMPQEMDGVKHYLIDELMPDEEFNIYIFQKMAKEALDEIYANNQIPVIVGGTGFYIQGLLYDINFEEAKADEAFRREMEEFARKNGAEALHAKLLDIDKESYDTIHPNNIKRVIRALEYYHLNKAPISEHNKKEREKESPYNFAYFVLNDLRDNLYKRIDLRVDIMMQNGLPEEIKKLKDMGYTRDMVSMQGLGYKELLDYYSGILSLDEAVDKIKNETRHFAKRQLTWFRREKEVEWINKQEFNYDNKLILEHALDILKEKRIINC